MLATPTIGPPETTCCPLELASPGAVPGVCVTDWEASVPVVVFVPCCDEDEDVWELELPAKALFEFPPNDDDCEKPPELPVPELPNPDCELPNPELPNPQPPNAELLEPEAEPFSCPTVFAPGITPPPMLPPRVTPGSP